MTTDYTLSPFEEENIISNRLFGCNLEMTRTTGFGGLYAQMLNNRKFYAHEEDEVCGWEYDGNVLFSTETRKSTCGSNFFILPQGGFLVAAQDNTVFLEKDRTYVFAAWVSGEGAACIKLADAAEQTVEINSNEPQKVEFELVPLKQMESCALSVEGISGKINLFSVSLMPADHFHNMRRDVVELLKELAPAQLRFPGGCFADHYNWKDNFIEADLRRPVDGKVMPFLLRNTYHQDCVELSIDDFMALCRYVGAEPELTVRMVHAPMQEAVDLVEYCNGDVTTKYGKIRQERGYEPYNVKEWYIGNEIYSFGRDETKDLVKDPVFAAEETKRYIAAMKKADPDIVAIATCHTELPQWNDEYFKNTEAEVDRYSYHCYLTCEFDKDFGYTPKERTLMVGKGRMETGFIKTHDLLKTATSGRHHAVSYDEWNFAWGQGGSTVMMVYNALVFNFLCRRAHEFDTEKALFFHPVNEGMIKVKKDGAGMDTSGVLMQLYAPHRDAQRLYVATDSTDDYKIDLAASVKGGKVFITAVNRNIDGESILNVSGIDLTDKKISVKLLIPEKYGFDCDNITVAETEIIPKGDILTFSIPAASVAAITVE